MKTLITTLLLLFVTLLNLHLPPVYAQQKTSRMKEKPKVNTEKVDVNKRFIEFKKAFLDQYWAVNPSSASYNGLGEYDTILRVPSPENHTEKLHLYKKLLKAIERFGAMPNLSTAHQTDLALMKNTLESEKWYLKTFKIYEWKPSDYNVSGGFHRILINKDLTSTEKIARVYPKMKNIPEFYEHAKQQLKQPTREHTELATYQLKGGLSVFEENMVKLVNEITEANFKKLGFSKEDFETRRKIAIQTIQAYIEWLKKNFLEKQGYDFASFRIGEKLYDEKFKYSIQSQHTAKEIYNKAVAEKEAIHQKMFKLTTELWPKYFVDSPEPEDKLAAVKQLIDKIALKHVHRDSFITAIRKQLPELDKFVKDKDLLYLDPSKPLEVRETPKYMRGVAGASISAPGPYDKNRPTYYNVTPLDKYTDEQAESYLREYNHYMLQILNIHEAIPGHYAQLVYSNKSPSLIKSLFGNGAMIEGWACYTERMMLEEGYGNHEPELWLMYYKWNLRIVCNTILDYSVHVLNMKEQEALDLLIKEAFQEEAEATGKWRRAQLTQVQLCSYFTGLMEIYEFREELKKKQGKKFSLKDFHEQFLSYGSAPVKEVRKLMLEE